MAAMAASDWMDLTLSCGFYLVCSAGMSIFNKLAVIRLPLPITLVIIQMMFTVATTLLSWRSLRVGSRRDALRWGLTVPLLFSAMLVSSMFAMRHNSLGTVAVFRNVAPLITLPIERCFRVAMLTSRGTVLSLLTVVAGVALYYHNTLQLTTVGFFAICLNMAFAVFERLLQRHLLAQDPVDLSKATMMLLNNSCGLVPNLLLLLPTAEPAQWGEVFGQMGSHAWFIIALSCFNGVAISYAGLKVQQMVTATTFMVLTNVNKFIVIFFGIVVLHDNCTPFALLGVLLAIGGALWYAHERRRLQQLADAGARYKEKSALAEAEEGEADEGPAEGAALLQRKEAREEGRS